MTFSRSHYRFEGFESSCLSANLYFDEINNAYFILRVYIVGLFASGMNGTSRKKLLEQLYQDVLSQRMKSGIADKISSKKTRSFLTDFLLKKF